MNTCLNTRVLLVTLLLLTAVSCAVNQYTVYDKTLTKVNIDLNRTDQAVILINNSYCAPCLPTLKDSLDSIYDNTILVCMIEKSKLAASLKLRELQNSNLTFDKVYFQFYKKNDPYKARMTNRLYLKYDSVVAPFALVNRNGRIVKVF